jgi:hypothetical protein
MPVTEQTRHDLHDGLIVALGKEKAATLMELLPPVGWGDVATRQDLRHEIAAQGSRLEALIERGLREQSRLFIFSMLASDMTLAGLVLAALHLT